MNKSVISKKKLRRRVHKKTDPKLAAAIFLATKNPAWRKLAKILSQSTRKQSAINLKQIDEKTSMGDCVIVPGKILSIGEITKKIKICSFGISKEAREKLTKTRSEWTHILDEIKKNTKAEGLKLIK